MARIALDFDNVLADTTTIWLKHYNSVYNKSIKKSDLDEYYFWHNLGISKEEAFRIFSVVWNNWRELPVIERDSVEIVNKMSSKAEIHLVSSALTDLRDWTVKNNFRFSEIVYSQQKSLLNYDVFIEDSPYEAMNIAKNNRLCLLYDQPWNRSIQSNKVIRIKKLSEASAIIERIMSDSYG